MILSKKRVFAMYQIVHRSYLDKQVLKEDNEYMNANKIEKISWQCEEHVHYEKTSDWYWIVSIVALGGIFLSLYFANFLFALIIIIFVATSFTLLKRKPRIMIFDISRKGIRAGSVLYPFSLLESFWVEDGVVEDKIIFKSKRPLSPFIVFPFDSTVTDPELLRDYLLDYLDEEELEEPLFQIIMEWFGF